ncbi:hypothetical protein BC629DRAFT_1113712 [Irpex lacteus]|nr:hypothetical protein BC629DRAFT_1113712 [Irpex lacteus]
MVVIRCRHHWQSTPILTSIHMLVGHPLTLARHQNPRRWASKQEEGDTGIGSHRGQRRRVPCRIQLPRRCLARPPIAFLPRHSSPSVLGPFSLSPFASFHDITTDMFPYSSPTEPPSSTVVMTTYSTHNVSASDVCSLILVTSRRNVAALARGPSEVQYARFRVSSPECG